MKKQSTLEYVDCMFDSSTEFCKSIVREMFHFSNQSIDGICAAILHILASSSPHNVLNSIIIISLARLLF
jgi:hypothetical protein